MVVWDLCGGKVPTWRGHAQSSLVSPPAQELERLEVERVEMIRQHLCQYTQLRHETDMFNQSVSSRPPAEASRAPGDPGPGRANTTALCRVAWSLRMTLSWRRVADKLGMDM